MATTTGPSGDVEIDVRDVDARLAMPLAEAMSTQRAIRRLLPDPVDDDVVLRCLELATHAPTGSNKQEWEFVVVRDAEVKHQLARLNPSGVRDRPAGRGQAAPGRPRRPRRLAAVRWQADHFEEVPVVVVICLHGRSPMFGPPILASSWYGSAFPRPRTCCWRPGPSASAPPSPPCRSGR